MAFDGVDAIVQTILASAEGAVCMTAHRRAARRIRIRTRALTGRVESFMNINLGIGPLVSLLAGILILVMPKMLNYIVAIYLIVIGLLGLFGAGGMHLR